jgi:uncharacterized small protein (DUF1192 family)
MCYTKGKRVCQTSIDARDLDAAFCAQASEFFASPERISSHLDKARAGLSEREARVASHKAEMEKVRSDMAKTHQLYLDGQIPKEGYTTFYGPLAERLGQLQAELPRIEAELSYLSVTSLSADMVVNEARSLYSKWPELSDELKVRIVQSLVERITIGEGEIEINFSRVPSSEEATKSQQLV